MSQHTRNDTPNWRDIVIALAFLAGLVLASVAAHAAVSASMIGGMP